MARTFKEKAAKFLGELRKGNWDYVLDAIAYRLPVWAFSYFHFYMYKAAKLDLKIVDHPEVWCRFGNLDDLDALVDLGLKSEVVKLRLDNNYRVAVVGKEQKILAVVWAIIDNPHLQDSDSYFVFGGYTRPEDRGQGLTSLAQKLIREYCAARGRINLIASIGALNTVSIRIHERMGFHKVGNAIYMIIFGVVIVYFKSWPFQERKLRLYKKRPPHNEKLWFLP